MENENVAALKRIVLEGFGAGNLSAIDEVVPESFVEHQAGIHGGNKNNMKALIRDLREAFPDLHYEVLRTAADGDIAWGHFRARGTNRGPFMGRPPTGRTMEIDVMEIMRFEKGMLVEHWGLADRFACLLQLGHFPPKQAGEIG
jgi:predicted ester cyclase